MTPLTGRPEPAVLEPPSELPNTLQAGEEGARWLALETGAVERARGLAAEWRAGGGTVGLVIRGGSTDRRMGYELTAADPDKVLTFACRRRLVREGRREARAVYVVTVTALPPTAGHAPGASPAAEGRLLGVVAAVDHEEAWRRLLGWIDGEGRLAASLDEALTDACADEAAASPHQRPGSRARHAVPVLASVAVGAAVVVGAYRLAYSPVEPAVPTPPVTGLTNQPAAASDRSPEARLSLDGALPRGERPAGAAQVLELGTPGVLDPDERPATEGEEARLRASLEASRRTAGPDDPATAAALAGLAGFYAEAGRPAEAGPLYREALAIDEGALGPGHPDTLTIAENLALVAHAEGRDGEAERLLLRVRATRERALGPHHPDVAMSLMNLAELYEDQGRRGEAAALGRRAAEVLERALGPDAPETAAARAWLAGLERDVGRGAGSPAGDGGAVAVSRPAVSAPPGGAVEPGPDLGRGPDRRQPAVPGTSEGDRGRGAPAPPGDRPAVRVAPRGGPYGIQVAAVRDPGAAAGEWHRLVARHPAPLAGLTPRPPQRIDAAGGSLYRLIAGPFATEAEARAACDRLRSEGGDCRVVAP